MRAVTGTVTSSKAISLSKASSILSRFAAADIGAPRDVAAYLKRSANALEDLVQFHRELRREKREIKQELEVEDESSTRGKRRKEQKDESLRIGEDGDLPGNVEDMKKKRMKSEVESRELESSIIAENGGLGVNVEEEKRKKKKKKLGDLERNNEEMNPMVKVKVKEEEIDWSEERGKKKEKKRKHFSSEEVKEEATDGSEKREKKKKRKNKVED